VASAYLAAIIDFIIVVVIVSRINDCIAFVRALYIQCDLRKDTENWFSALQKAMAVSVFYCLL